MSFCGKVFGDVKIPWFYGKYFYEKFLMKTHGLGNHFLRK